MLKCCSDRWVCGPHSLSAETSTAPRLSNSVRTSVIRFSYAWQPGLHNDAPEPADRDAGLRPCLSREGECEHRRVSREVARLLDPSEIARWNRRSRFMTLLSCSLATS